MRNDYELDNEQLLTDDELVMTVTRLQKEEQDSRELPQEVILSTLR